MTHEKPEEVVPEQIDRPAMVQRVRQFVRAQLSEGASAPDLSFALAYIATDLGLSIAPSPLHVFPIVMEGISQASSAHSEAVAAPAEECKAEQMAIPSASTIH